MPIHSNIYIFGRVKNETCFDLECCIGILDKFIQLLYYYKIWEFWRTLRSNPSILFFSQIILSSPLTSSNFASLDKVYILQKKIKWDDKISVYFLII